MIDLHDKALVPRSLEIGFHPFIRGLTTSTPRIWYASLFNKPRCRYQPSWAISKISYNVGNWYTSPPLRRETAGAGPSFLITPFKIITGLLDIDPNSFFLPLAQRSLRGHPYIVLKGASHRQRRGSAFSVRLVKYWNEVPAPSVNVFKKRREKVWTEVFPHLPHRLNAHFLIVLPLLLQSHLRTTH